MLKINWKLIVLMVILFTMPVVAQEDFVDQEIGNVGYMLNILNQFDAWVIPTDIDAQSNCVLEAVVANPEISEGILVQDSVGEEVDMHTSLPNLCLDGFEMHNNLQGMNITREIITADRSYVVGISPKLESQIYAIEPEYGLMSVEGEFEFLNPNIQGQILMVDLVTSDVLAAFTDEGVALFNHSTVTSGEYDFYLLDENEITPSPLFIIPEVVDVSVGFTRWSSGSAQIMVDMPIGTVATFEWESGFTTFDSESAQCVDHEVRLLCTSSGDVYYGEDEGDDEVTVFINLYNHCDCVNTPYGHLYWNQSWGYKRIATS